MKHSHTTTRLTHRTLVASNYVIYSHTKKLILPGSISRAITDECMLVEIMHQLSKVFNNSFNQDRQQTFGTMG
jgi:hypothetical protein